MSLMTQTLSGLYDGISQQPAPFRTPAQCEDQINCLSSIADGVTKRPPSVHLAKLQGGDLSGALIHTINRDTSERYVVVLQSGNVVVYDALTGAAETVNITNPDYLVCDDPRVDFAVVTVADYTFIVNRRTVTAMSGEMSTSGNLKGVKQRFRDLNDISNPIEADLWEIAGDETNQFDSFYVRRTAGVWRESFKPGELYKFDQLTMPHALVRLGNGTFEFRPIDWSARITGDAISDPEPSFIGKAINDVFFYRNRLGLAAGENVIFSAAGDFFNFWRDTVTQLLDNHPIDVAATHTSVSTIHYAVPFNKTLMLMSDQTQFVLNAGQILSPQTVGIDQSTAFEMSRDVRPVGAGSNLYFPTNQGNFTAIREYYVEDNAVTDDASDITAHVPRLVPKGVFKLTASSNAQMLFALSAEDAKTVYVYKWYWSGQERAQSSWGKWTFTGDVLSADVFDHYLLVLLQHPDGVYLERINLQSGANTAGLFFECKLDRQVALTGTYDSFLNLTTWELPFAVDVSKALNVVLTDSFGAEAGKVIDPATMTRPDSTSVQATGDHSGGVCIVGVPYTQSYQFSTLFVQSDNTKYQTGRLQIRTMLIYYTDTGFFRIRIKRLGRADSVSTVSPDDLVNFTGRTIGSASYILTAPSLASGHHRFPIYGHSTHTDIILENDSPLPSTFHKAEWEGFFTAHSRLR